jgi:Circularly permutated YpsA SLOG family
LLRIVSGGQTGVDRGALDAALDLDVECGGWCPEGRLAEDGTIPERYPVIELTDAGYAERTAQNVADSDGTLIISNGELIGGTRETVERCVEMGKPYLAIDCEGTQIEEAIELAVDFIRSLSSRKDTRDAEEVALKLRRRDPSVRAGLAIPPGVTVLNVAGPRASQWSEGHALTYQIMSVILRRISGQSDAN